ncbi:MAG: hypothetical protein IJ146_09610 [Kiritimatiellae bacterium]|nr:hypothetical protein [Kiritimatiellia bacterium]
MKKLPSSIWPFAMCTAAFFLALCICCGCDRQNDVKPAPKTQEAKAVDELQAAIEAAPQKNAVSSAATNAPAVTSAPKAAKVEVPKPKPKPEPMANAVQMRDYGFDVVFSCMPDLASLADHVKVEPSAGPLTIGYTSWNYSCSFRGAFKPRNSYTVTVRAGTPMADGRKTAKDFRRTFTMRDRPRRISFAAEGRYLPAAGSRAIAVKTMNVTNLLCETRPVPLKNIVQLMAREAECYDSFYGGGGDSGDAAELAGDPVKKTVRVKTVLNEEVVTVLPVRDADGKAENGVYLVSVCAKKAGAKTDEGDGPCSWRLVCVTDIGLSVRQSTGGVSVWATSLSSGRPIEGLRAVVYGSNGIAQAEGLTDADGWCMCELPNGKNPFAVVVAKMDETDAVFLSLRGPVEEPDPGPRRSFVPEKGSEAYVWTDRGIYRHGEPILVHAILRDGKGNAPRPFPVEIRLLNPEGEVTIKRTQVSDSMGVVARSDFSVAQDQPSGWWTIDVFTPGDEGTHLGSARIKVEEFVPPQIRVKVTPPAEGTQAGTNLMFTVAAEHLFGGPAKGLPAEAAVMFEDEPFAPRGWEAFRFGDETRRLAPNFKTLDNTRLDAEGKTTFSAEFPKKMRPRAAVKMTMQGSVFESGGRPASARASTIVHAYPHYIGVALPNTLKAGAEKRRCRVVVVNPDGSPCRGERRLTARFERVETVYGLKQSGGSWEWRSDKVRIPLGDEIEVVVPQTGMGMLEVPAPSCGDYAVTLREQGSDVTFSASYWVGGEGDGAVRAPLENPSRVSLKADKKVYHPGDRPRITVKAPFAGSAWLAVMRDKTVYSQILSLTNATCELELEPVETSWTPGVDVALSVVQAVKPGPRQVANRAIGRIPLKCATLDSSIDVQVKAAVECVPMGGSHVVVDVTAAGQSAVGERAVVTVVDEGINMLTSQKTPDPAGWFGEPRAGEDSLYDVYNRILPILGDGLKRAGAKTGGGADGDLFRRVSPVPSRRYKPLSMWKLDVPLKAGRATVPFELPEFVGEVRVTAVAYNARATGASSVQAKVTPNLVMQPDAPRFAAPGDEFLVTMTLSNRSGAKGAVAYDLMAGGSVGLSAPVHGKIELEDGASETLTFPVRAQPAPGEGTIVFVAEGLGEKHKNEILLPVRPAAPWVKKVETVALKAGERRVFHNTAAMLPGCARRTFLASGSPVAELASALEYLTGYPYGCLEQTVSRVFPLVAAGGLLNTLPVSETSAAEDAKSSVTAGIRRVCDMVRANDFVMWPDCDVPPWDSEVSLWAAHFLVEASKGGFEVPKGPLGRVRNFLRGWAMSTNETESVYACHTLALAGQADRDRMLHWFDRRASLSPLSRARLARAFARGGDVPRAKTLVDSLIGEPASVKDAAFAILARLDVDPKDERLAALALYLISRRNASTCHWDTTEANAHVLLALGSYYRATSTTIGIPEVYMQMEGAEARKISPKRAERMTGGGDVTLVNKGQGDAFATVTCLALADAASLSPETRGISVSRRFLRTDGTAAAPDGFVRGEMLVVEVTLSAPVKTVYSDLVLEELLPACFEPDHTPLGLDAYPFMGKNAHGWLLRREMRDDRVLGFSRRFSLGAGESVRFFYPVRVVSAGDFILPGSSVEAMYNPAVHASGASGRVKVTK